MTRCACAQDQYIEISTALPASASLYGLGESTRMNGFALPRNGSVQTLWARDSPAALPLQNTYSAWPFYMDVRAGERRCTRALKNGCIKVSAFPSVLRRFTGCRGPLVLLHQRQCVVQHLCLLTQGT